MPRLRLAAFALIALGVALLLVAAARGDVRVGFFLVIPFVAGTGLLPFLGTLALMAGVLMLFLGAAAPHARRDVQPEAGAAWEPGRERSSGGVILLGPIPIVWGSDRRILPWMVAAGVLLLALSLGVGWLLSR